MREPKGAPRTGTHRRGWGCGVRHSAGDPGPLLSQAASCSLIHDIILLTNSRALFNLPNALLKILSMDSPPITYPLSDSLRRPQPLTLPHRSPWTTQRRSLTVTQRQFIQYSRRSLEPCCGSISTLSPTLFDTVIIQNGCRRRFGGNRYARLMVRTLRSSKKKLPRRKRLAETIMSKNLLLPTPRRA